MTLGAKLLLLLHVGLILESTAQTKDSFILKGKIQGLKDGAKVYLVTNEIDTIGICESVAEKFEFTGSVEGQANYYYLRLDTSIQKNPTPALWLTNSSMTVEASMSDWPNILLKGSEPHDEYTELIQQYSIAKKKGNEIEVMLKFVHDHPNSLYVSNLILKLASELKSNGLQKAYTRLSSRAKTSYYGIKLRNEIDRQQSIKTLHLSNNKIPNFQISSPDGKKQFVMDLIANSKYTLVDFWASWCAPCRASLPSMLKTYDSFHHLGFNIIGVSIDKKETDWLNAIEADKTPWFHGRDNLQNANKTIFGLVAIPGYLLVDSSGRIIKSDIVADSNLKIKKVNEERLGTDLYTVMKKLFEKK